MSGKSDFVARMGARLAWQLRVVWERLGFLELLAVALLALWMGLAWQVNAPLQVQLEQVNARAQTLAREAEARSSAAQPAVPEGIHFSVLDRLPGSAKREAQIGQIQALAEASGVTVDRIDYRFERRKSLPVTALVLRFSGVGPYTAHRRLLHQVLRQHENSAVERMGLEREKDSLSSLRVTFDIALYYREAS